MKPSEHGKDRESFWLRDPDYTSLKGNSEFCLRGIMHAEDFLLLVEELRAGGGVALKTLTHHPVEVLVSV